MNYDERYWRARAVEAQEQAANEYRLSRHYDGHVGRAMQLMAYETHLKALARLGWAEVERGRAEPGPKPSESPLVHWERMRLLMKELRA